jgi:hypothetical protein
MTLYPRISAVSMGKRVTWGRLQRGTWAWFEAMVDEAWAVLPSSWQVKGRDPIPGFAFTTLENDLAAL